MWQRFTERARKVIFYAQEEAGIDSQTFVGTEHILAGLIRDQDSVANRLLAKLNVQREAIQAELSQRRVKGDGRNGQDMQLTPRSKRVIDLAYDEARQLNNNYIGSEHLLLGLLREVEGVAGQVLRNLGLELPTLREAVRELQASKSANKPTVKSPSDQAPEIDPIDLVDLAAQEPVIRIANSIIQQAIHEGASVIHVEPEHLGVRIRYRIDGVLNEIMTVPNHVKEDLVTRFKTMADLNAARHDILQQGMIHIRLEGKKLQLSASVFPTRKGEAIVMHILQEPPAGLEAHGIQDDDLATLRTWTARRSGLILLSGSTGAGKSVTALNLLREIINPEQLAVAIQHTYDHELLGVTTLSADAKTGMSLEQALETALIGVPDVISIGSVLSHPSEPALRLVLEAALSGPLVLMEYNASSAARAVNRILSTGISMRLVNDTLIGVVGQSLIRRICERCKRLLVQPLSSQMRDQSRLGGYDPPADVVLYEGAGCDYCRGTGYKGQIGLFELLPWNQDMAEAAQRQASAEAMTALAVTHGMKTRFADGVRKAVLGLTTVEEVERRAGR